MTDFDIAVLLPVRLETLFLQDDVGQWTLLLRIIPDEASIRRDNPSITPFEVESLTAMWQAIYADLSEAERAQPVRTWLDSPRGKVEWSLLCSRLGGGRAAAIAARYPPSVDGETVSVDVPAGDLGKAPPNRVGGFPEMVEIWVDFGQGADLLATTPSIDQAALTFDVIGQRKAEDGQVLEEQDRWWVSWETAKAVGLGIEKALPDGHTPGDIRVLYAIGVGEENPEQHLRAQIEAGEMAVLSPGAPTNAVDGKQAADLATGPETWRVVAQQRLAQTLEAWPGLDLGFYLAGAEANLPAVPQGQRLPEIDQVVVGALWPALWGHFARDLWGWGPQADRMGMWAHSFLRPGGPLPAIRIDTQPYGLLPTSALSRWKAAAGEPELAKLEDAMAASLLELRSKMDQAARYRGTAFDADAARLIELISRDALSPGYGYRYFLPLLLWEYIYSVTTPGFDPTPWEAKMDDLFAPAYRVMQHKPGEIPGFRHHVSGGYFQDLNIPLVVPTRWPRWFYKQDGQGFVLDENGQRVPAMTVAEGFVRLLKAIQEHGSMIDLLLEEDLLGTLPDSLLLRLLIYANLLSAAAVVQELEGAGPILEPIVNGGAQTWVQELASRYRTNLDHSQPAGEVRVRFTKSLDALVDWFNGLPEPFVLAELERSLRASLDSAAQRIDPWITGLAYRRLGWLAGRREARFRLGVYGWVEGPVQGKPGPNEGGLLHAPSYAQALTGVILRDKFISEDREIAGLAGARNVWDMQLESRQIRAAVEMAEEARLGSHLFEVVGRQVERIVGSRAAIESLRLTFPLKSGKPDRKRVCHGIQALQALLGNAPPLAVSPQQVEQLKLLRQSIDTYGDLLVAEAVHNVVSGRADTAGAAMDAAAGLSQPPTLEFTQTPLSGYSANTAVLSVFPFHEPLSDPDPANPPARIADGSAPAVLETLLGTAEQWVWSWQPEGQPLRAVSLQDLGLEPVDSVVLAVDLLEEMARFKLGAAHDQPLEGSGPQKQRLARQIVAVLGNQAALVRDLAPQDEPEAEVAATRVQDTAILNELAARYGVLRASAQRLIYDLGAAITANDQPALRVGLSRALRWGLRPVVEQGEQQALFEAIFNGVDPADAALLSRLAERARQALQNRLKAAPAPGAVPGARENKQPLSRSIAELAAPEGQLAILSKIDSVTLTAKSRVVTAGVDARLGEDWLAITAAVRPALARLEALQLEAQLDGDFAGFESWSSAPQDHWQTQAVALWEQRRQVQGENVPLVLPRFVSAFTAGNVFGAGAGPLAVGLVDSWGEAIPRTRHTSTAAFGFNAPIARAPQAILLAVPPDLESGAGAPFDTIQLVQILDETRQLAHARAVRFEDLGEYLAAVPSTMFQGTEPSGVRLDPSTNV